jgi:hypothetical protein
MFSEFYLQNFSFILLRPIKNWNPALPIGGWFQKIEAGRCINGGCIMVQACIGNGIQPLRCHKALDMIFGLDMIFR